MMQKDQKILKVSKLILVLWMIIIIKLHRVNRISSCKWQHIKEYYMIYAGNKDHYSINIVQMKQNNMDNRIKNGGKEKIKILIGN